MLVNVPLIVEHWDRPAVGIRNIGDVPIMAVVTIEGPGWGPSEATVPNVEPGERVDVPLSGIGTEQATVRAVVTSRADGMDHARIVLESVARHQSWWEAHPEYVVLLLAAVLAGVLAIRHREPVR